jgi:hypothetical protein
MAEGEEHAEKMLPLGVIRRDLQDSDLLDPECMTRRDGFRAVIWRAASRK